MVIMPIPQRYTKTKDPDLMAGVREYLLLLTFLL